MKHFVLWIWLATATDLPGAPTKNLVVNGLKRTDKAVVEEQLGWRHGVDSETLEKNLQNLRNTGLFASVKGRHSDDTYTVTVEERWTTIPIAKFSAGGGVKQFTLGVYDINVAGKYLEMGGQFQKLGDTNSGVFWLGIPQFRQTPTRIDLQVWKNNRIRTKYFQEPQEAVILTGFLHDRTKLYLGLNYQLSRTVQLAASLENHRDEFSRRYLPDEVLSRSFATDLPPSTQISFIGFGATLGKLNASLYQTIGQLLSFKFRLGLPQTDSIASFGTFDLEYQNKTRFAQRRMLAVRLKAGSTNTSVLQYWHYLGGLDSIRGFVDNRFAGSKYWLGNFEFRNPLLTFKGLILQNTIFYDSVGVGEKLSDLESAKGTSIGVGIRVIAPKIYRFVARLDIAKPVLRKDENPISFGVQQFF